MDWALPPVERLVDVEWTRFTQRAQEVPPQVAARAHAILTQVADEGDEALRALTLELDGCDLPDPWLADDAWTRLAAGADASVRSAIDGNLARIRAFHARQVPAADEFEVVPGLRLGRRPVALDVAACYVPGGRASYPSTVLMTVVPAVLAGVGRVIVATPPRPDGSIDAAVAYAARAAGAHAILRAGGAQAIAALAHGTDLVPAVDAVVGPGNAYVTAAKQLVQDRVRIDSPAGPSELLVICDATCNPDHMALDLLAQAEHDPDAQVILVATDATTAAAVRDRVVERLPNAPRAEIAGASLQDHGAFLVAAGLEEALRFANAYAGEHVELVVADPRAALAALRSAGSVFLGPHAPVSLGDYGSGTNHVLPTMGHAARRGGLAVEDFIKWITWQEVSGPGLAAVAGDVSVLAHAEGLHNHAAAVETRVGGHP